ncbi:MAG: iron complex outermembrane receptor protein [Saprospiraceae bacterium]|jgi:iron complex outermembrane receptor protein
MRIAVYTFLATCCLISIEALSGQSQESIESSFDSVGIENITIVSTRANITDPLSIQNISKATIDNISFGQDPAVLLGQLSPSIVTYSDAGTDIGNYAQFRMRGISQNRINISLNGVPLNDMLDQGVYFSNFSDFGNSIESIQIQRGVGASNVGVSSYGGAVNFQSSNIFHADPRAELQLTTGSFGTIRAAGEVSTGLLSNNTALYSRFSKTKTDGYKDHSASDAYSMFFSGGHIFKNQLLKFTAFAGKTQNDQSYLPVLLSDLETNPKTNYNHPNDTDDFEQEMIQLQYSNQHSSAVSTSYTAYYSGARGVFPFGIDNSTQYMYFLSNSRYGLLANMNYNYNNWDIKSGIHAYTMDRINVDYVSPDISNPSLRELTDKNELSAFIKTGYGLGKIKLYADLAIRNVNVDFSPDPVLLTGISHDRDWTFFNWILGTNLSINERNSFYISYGRTGREPTRSDMLNGSEEDIKNNLVTEEFVNDFELGWRYTNNIFSLNANLFHMNFQNEISKIGALQERSYMEVTQNVDESSRSGIELQAMYKASSNTTINLNATYMNTNVTTYQNGDNTFTDVEQIFAPKWLISPSVTQNLSKSLKARVSGRYASQSFMELSNDPTFTFPSYFILDAQLDYSLSDNIQLSASINNITDQLYFTDGAPVDLDFDGNVEGPGYRIQPVRNFYFMLKIRL